MRTEIQTFISTMIKDTTRATEICDQTFRLVGKLKAEFQTRAMLMTTARNLCLDELQWMKQEGTVIA